MRRILRLSIRMLWWQALLAIPIVGLRFALAAAGLNKAAADADEIRIASLGEGYVLKSEAKAFRGGAVAWLMGGFVLDLRSATIAPGGADLRLVTLMGGSVLIVSPDLEVAVRQRGFGGGSNVPPSESSEGAALRVDALTIMGGFNLVKRPLGEDGAGTSPLNEP